MIVNRAELIEAIKMTTTTASKVVPAYGCILLEARDGKLILSGSNREIYISATLAGNNGQLEPIAPPNKNLLRILTNMVGDTVKLETKKNKLQVTSTTATIQIESLLYEDVKDNLLESEEKGKKKKDVISFRVGAKKFREILSMAARFACTDESKQALCSVNLVYKSEKIEARGTDGYRLFLDEFEPDTVPDDLFDILVPSSSIAQIVEVLGTAGERSVTVEIVDKSKIRLATETCKISVVLLDYKYPDVRAIIPTSKKATLIINKEDLESAIRLALQFGQGAKIVKLQMTDGDVMVYAKEQEKGSANIVLSPENGSEGAIDVAFNGEYMLDSLKAVHTDAVELQMTVPTRPLLARATEPTKRICVMMPMNPPRQQNEN